MDPDDTRLMDRTGVRRLATADPSTNTISISRLVRPPLLDRVIVHEVAHAVTMSYGLLESLHSMIPYSSWVQVEEWVAELIEKHGIETVAMASESLGRPVCVRGYCHD